MEGLSTITPVSCGAYVVPRQPCWAVTSHVCTESVSLTGGQVQKLHGVSVYPENPVERSHPLPMMELLKRRRKGHYPLKFSSLCPHPSSRTVKLGQLRQTQSLLWGWQNLVYLLYFTFGGWNCLFFLGKVKDAICLVSLTFKALQPLNFYAQILLFSTSIIIKL